MRKWLPLAAVCAGTFMLLVDVTIVNVALPDMARSLHTTFTDLQWVVDLYALVLGALVLTAGAIADRVGRRRLYLVGLVTFAAASALCGAAPDTAVLIAARGVQGTGAAMMFATTMALISSSYQGRDRGIAFGAWGAVNGAAAAAGPIAGGLLTANFGWRWIFFVNLPVSVVAVVMTWLVVAESRDPAARRIDPPGMASFTAAAACLTYALIRGDWSSAPTLGLLAGFVTAVMIFILVELRRRDPMLDLGLLRNRSFTVLLVAGGLLSAAAWAPMTYTSLWLQSLLGLSPIRAGLVLLPSSVCALILSAGLGRYLHHASPRLLIGAGLLVIGAGAGAQSVIRTGSGWAVIIPGVTLIGIGAGLAIAPLSSAAMALVPWQRAGMAAGALTTFRQLGYAFGIAVLGEVFRSGVSGVVGARLAGPVSGGAAGSVLAGDPGASHLLHHAFAHGLDLTQLVACGLGVLAGLLVLGLVRDRAPHITTGVTSSPAEPVKSRG